MSTELTVSQSNVPSILTDVDYGFDGISSENIQIPRIKLCQNATRTRPKGCNPGDWFNSVTEKIYGPSIVMNIFKSGKQKARFSADYKLICRSADGIRGPEGVLCKDCPHSKWQDDAKLRKEEYCPDIFTFLVALEGERLPSLVSLSKTRQKVADSINSNLRYLIAENQGLSPDRRTPIYFYKVALSSFQTDYNGNQIYDVKFKMNGKEMEEDRQRLLIGLYREYKTFVSQVMPEDEGTVSKGNEVSF